MRHVHTTSKGIWTRIRSCYTRKTSDSNECQAQDREGRPYRTCASRTPSCASCPATRCGTTSARGAQRLLHACRSDAGAGAAAARLVRAVGEMLGIARPQSPTGAAAEVLAGNRVLPGMQPYAARYGGHQFGHWAGQLGDGRAITLGEVVDAGRRRATSCSSRARGRRRTRAPPTAARCCARRCASSCAARRCTTSACRPRAR